MATEESAARLRAWPVLALGVAVLVGSAGGPVPDDARTLARAGALTAIGLTALAVGLALLAPRPVPDTLRLGPSRPPVTPLEVALFTFGLLALSATADFVLEQGGWRAGSRLDEIERILAGAAGADLAIVVAGLALAPAIAEELFFRGLVLGALLRRAPTWLAVAGSAVLFGAAHLDAAQGAATAVLGVYLGAVAVATGSIRAGVIAHLGNNAVALLAPALAEPAASTPPLVGVPLAAGGLAALGGATVVLVRRLRGRSDGPD